MWDFSFMIPCVLMLFTILGFYFSEPRLPIRANRTFMILLALELFVMASDIVSSLADQNYQSLSSVSLYVANTIYFMLFFAQSYWFYRFGLGVIHITSEAQRRIEILLSMPFWLGEALCVSSAFTGAVFYIDSTGYHSGPLYGILYLCSFLYIGLSLLLLFRRGQGLRRHERNGLIAYNAILLAGNVLRMLLPRVLVMDTFCTMAITTIFFAFMNPHLYIDQSRIAFNKRGLRILLSEAHENDGLHVLGMVVKNYQQDRVVLGSKRIDGAIESICIWLMQSFPQNVLFYLGSGRLAMTGENDANWEDVYQRIRTRFFEPWETDGNALDLDVRFVNIDETTDLNTPDVIIGTLLFALESAARDSGTAPDSDKDILSIEDIHEEIKTIRTLERVLEHNEVEVFLQPIVLSGTHRLVGAEALARIRDEHGDIVPPSLFIPIAEHEGLIDKLGIQVLNNVCVFIASHDLRQLGLQWININLSPLQCVQRDIVERFTQILEQHDISPDLIHLEITEQSLIDYSLVEKQVLQLHDMGFRFSLDDYGTGYSNLVRLSDYPFANIKLDMSLVHGYSNDKNYLLPVMVSALKDVGYTITAEGIETEEMARCISDIGADYLQGYLFSKPLPIDEFVRTYG